MKKKTGPCPSCIHFQYGCCPLSFFPSVKAQCSIYTEPGSTPTVRKMEKRRKNNEKELLTL